MKIARYFCILFLITLPLASALADDAPSTDSGIVSINAIDPAVLPGQIVSPLAGQIVQPLPGEIVPPLLNQLTPLLAGQGVQPLSGQIVPALSGQLVPPLPGQMVRLLADRRPLHLIAKRKN